MSPSSGVEAELSGHGRKEESNEEAKPKRKSTEILEYCKTKRLRWKECKVVLERLEFKEVMITTPCGSPGLREVFYVSTYELDAASESDSYYSSNELYEDFRVVTVEALHFRPRTTKSAETKIMESNSSTGSKLNLLLRFPSEKDSIFLVKHAEGDLHSILSLLSGEGMARGILEAYLILCLEEYWDSVHKKLEKNQKMLKPGYQLRHEKEEEPPPTNFQFLSHNFMPVKDRDQPVSTYKVNMQYFPKLEKNVLESCTLIAPQYSSKHFYLAVFNFPNKCVQLHDSSWHYLPLELRIHQIKAILRALDDDPLEWTYDIVKKSSPQFDEYSCGIYTIYYAENMLKGAPVKRNLRRLPDRAVKDIRKRITKKLLVTTSTGRQILEALTYS